MRDKKLNNNRLVALAFGASLGAGLTLMAVPAYAETISDALARAYQHNSTINASRATLRVTNENVAIAKSRFRPTVNGTATASYSTAGTGQTASLSYGVQVDQTLFAGFRNVNNVRASKAQVFAQRENLRNTSITVLSDTATAFTNVYRDRQIVSLRRKNLAFLEEQLRSARVRFNVGEATRTDVSLSSARLSGATAQLEGQSATCDQ